MKSLTMLRDERDRLVNMMKPYESRRFAGDSESEDIWKGFLKSDMVFMFRLFFLLMFELVNFLLSILVFLSFFFLLY